jgi:hypothetical protein
MLQAAVVYAVNIVETKRIEVVRFSPPDIPEPITTARPINQKKK